MATAWKKCRFADLIPDQKLDLTALQDDAVKSSAIETAYQGGFTGSFLNNSDGPLGSASRWYRDEFRSNVGMNQYRVSDSVGNFQAAADTTYGYIASADAFTAWKRDKAADAIDWLFQFYQNSGNCVGASWTEMLQGIAGTRAMDPALNESMTYLPSMWVYAWRGYCGAGWYGSACASMTIEHGYIFAFPRIINKYSYGGEQDGEDYTVRTWCRGGPPDDICAYVDSNSWRFEDGAISEMDNDLESLKAVARLKGQFHHGSNTTSGSHKPNVFQSIGGHQQTCYGVSWHPLVFKFYESKGFKLSADDVWTFNHQTWGSGFSGEIDDEYYPYGYDNKERVYSWAEIQANPALKEGLTLLAGEKPQGAWVVSGSGLLKRVEGYAYLPKFKGLPGTTPPTPPTPPSGDIKLTGELVCDIPSPIRGVLTAECNGAISEFIIVPTAGGKYRPQKKIG